MSLIRTFIAVDISAEVRARAAALIERLQASEVKASWTRPENMHLTLKFLGDTPDAKIADVCRAVAAAAQSQAPLQMRLAGAGAFPRLASPRTAWIGVTDGGEQLGQLQQALEDELYEAGFSRERRRFVPHLTLGRVRAGGPAMQELGRLIDQNSDFDAGACWIEEVVTYASSLEKTGPVYQVMGRAPLGK